MTPKKRSKGPCSPKPALIVDDCNLQQLAVTYSHELACYVIGEQEGLTFLHRRDGNGLSLRQGMLFNPDDYTPDNVAKRDRM